MFSIPYRWTWKTAHRNIGWIFYSIKRGIQNVIQWTPVIWDDEDFDFSYLAKIMEFKLRNMSRGFKAWDHFKGSQKDARQMLICAEILKRLREDDWEGVTGKQHMTRMRGWQELLGKLIGRHLMTWWD